MPEISYNMEPLTVMQPLTSLTNGMDTYISDAETSIEDSPQMKIQENVPSSTLEKEFDEEVEETLNEVAEKNGVISNNHETEKTETISIKEALIPKDVIEQQASNVIVAELPKLIPIKSVRQEVLNRIALPPLVPITKHNNRLCIAQLIERKLKKEIGDCDYVKTPKPVGISENGTEEDENTVPVIEEIEGDNVHERKQLIGTLVKGVRKSVRPTKPPWLLKTSEKDSSSNFEKCINESDNQTVEIVPRENEMREKLFNQLKQLKVKKTEPLVSTYVPKVHVNLRYEKRLIKTDALNVDDNATNKIITQSEQVHAHFSGDSQEPHTSDESDKLHTSTDLENSDISAELEEPHSSGKESKGTSSLGLQIVAVIGGVDIDDCEKLIAVDNIANAFNKSASENSDDVDHKDKFDIPNANEVIINNHLDLPTIKLTKTYDYKKIKGWCNKRLITVDQIGESKCNPGSLGDPEPSCSYNVHANEEKCSSSIQSDNVFASKGLDGFLAQKDLNISYNVPNLKSTNQNINLLDDCMLVDVEQERKNESQRKSFENEDSNSSSSFKDYGKINDYKPRTLAEKRKMLSDEIEKAHTKKYKHDTRRSRAKRLSEDEYLDVREIKTEIQPVMPVLEPPVLIAEQPENDDDDDDNLLIPIDQLDRIFPDNELEAEKTADVVFLTEEESKPKNCVISRIRFRSRCNVVHPVEVPTRVPIKRTFYHKISDVRRKWRYEYVVKYKRPFRTKPPIMKKAPVVDYKPGPLCKKKSLQVNANQVWRTVVVDLPRVTLEVVPKFCAPVHPTVRPFVEFRNFELNETRTDFALSALRGSNNTQAFHFPVNYAHGQEKLLCRKLNERSIDIMDDENLVESVVTKYEPETEEQVDEAIQSVVAGMLNYVELKEVDETKHDYDKDIPEALNEESTDVSKGCGSQKLKRLDRVGHALRVLGVRIVDLSHEEKVASGDSCTQEQCKFGCVCQSIRAQYPPLSHCGEAKCIFGCECGFENAALNNNKDIDEEEWNEHAIKRFNKEATKHITAREERDFMQTAIRSSDNKIILGKVRESKRTRKYNFKRYAGFHFSFTIDDTGMFQESSKAIIKNDPKLRRCHVDLVRCDFTDFIPFCMVHNLYDCHCKGTATFSESDKIIMLAAKKAHKPVEINTNASNNVDNDPPPPKLQREVAPPPPPPVVVAPVKQNMNYFNNKANMSARIRGTGEYYCLRNKTNRYKTTMARKLKYDKTVDMEIVTKWIILPSDIRAGPQNNKRKQDLTPKDDVPECVELIKVTDTDVGEDEESSCTSEDVPSLYKIEPPSSSQYLISIPSDNLQVVHTLAQITAKLQSNGTLYAPTTSINERFSAMLNAKSKTLSNFRLLLWPVLMKLYLSGDINIWINRHNVKYRFVVTDVTVSMKDGYENIRLFEGMRNINIKVDFIKWIVTRTLPHDKDGANILVIIKLLDSCWEICGICARNTTTSEMASGPPFSKRTKIEKDRPVNKKILIVEKSSPANPPRVVGEHKNGETSNVRTTKDSFEVKKEIVQRVEEKYYKTTQQVSFAHGTFTVKSLVLSNPQDKAVGERAMIAALPYITHDYRWRVLKVNSNFKILSFSKNKFSIKCSDILTIMKAAIKCNKTIMVNMDELRKLHKHPAFSIFIPATHQDRIFIGPYKRDEDHGLETLRFLNNKLINTEEFNKMRGILNVACTGLWYDQYGRSSLNTVTEGQSSVIDLTSAEEKKDVVRPKGLVITPVEHCVKLKAAQMKSRSVLKPLPAANLTPLGIKSEDRTASNNFPLAAISIPKLVPHTKAFKRVVDDKHIRNSAPLEPPSSNKLKQLLQTSTDKKYNLHMPEAKKPVKLPTDNILTDYVDIVHLEKSPNKIEELFFAKLRELVTQIGVILPANAVPVCFRLNFGNGIIIAYRIKKRINIFWPGDRNRVIQFNDFEHAVKWLKSELQRVFISIPTTFKIIVSPVGPAHYREYMNRSVISENYFKEICIIGEFGIMRFSEARPYLLCTVTEACEKLSKLHTKSDKFKKAIFQIINCNDMKPNQLLAKVNTFVARIFKSVDNKIPESPPEDVYAKKFVFTKKLKKAWPKKPLAASSETRSSLQSSAEVICIDSDGEETMYQLKVNSNAMTKKFIQKKLVLSDDDLSLKSLLKSNQEKQFNNITIMPPVGSDGTPNQTDENVVHVNFKDMSLKDIKAVLSFYGNKGLTPKDPINKSDKVSPTEATTNCR